MTAVLQFAQRDRGNVASTLPSGSAEIIIFPGVRFERLGSDVLPEDGKPNGSGPVQHRAAQ
jgi:hypothetical protein